MNSFSAPGLGSQMALKHRAQLDSHPTMQSADLEADGFFVLHVITQSIESSVF